MPRQLRFEHGRVIVDVVDVDNHRRVIFVQIIRGDQAKFVLEWNAQMEMLAALVWKSKIKFVFLSIFSVRKCDDSFFDKSKWEKGKTRIVRFEFLFKSHEIFEFWEKVNF